MNLMDAINTRRSVRHYSDQAVAKETVELLLAAAVQAPSASNSQPWAFAVIQDSQRLKQYSDRAKAYLLSMIEVQPGLAKYRGMLENADFNIFYNANTLVIIYAKPEGLHPAGDCCLAAQNLMLTAHDQGLGSCWIGFARTLLDLPELKAELGVPSDYSVEAPVILGYPQGRIPQLSKKDPEILFWL
ncbi:MAG: nitroreductase family protein [Negativicutes bacterium]|nr:nitroreductase family protein [Negativicutes bacterium]